MRRSSFIGCLLPALATVAEPQSGGPDSALARTRIAEFQHAWGAAWRTSEALRHSTHVYRHGGLRETPGMLTRGEESRFYAYHCDGPVRRIGRGWLFRGNITAFAVCPGWLRTDAIGPVADERLALDFGLHPEHRGAIRRARDSLINVLDSLAARAPASDFLAGQRVRFLVDQWEYPRALDAARACRGTPAWCARLVGYVYAAAGELVAADAAFRHAADLDDDTARCAWNDHRAVLDSIARPAYAALACSQRDSANAWLWALADPLWSEPGHPRFTEHSVRQMLIALRSALGRDERFSWDDRLGNDARREMILRYGWPTYHFWPGDDEEIEHSRHMDEWWSSPLNPPYTTYEYTPERQRILPLGRAVLSPFTTTIADFDLVSPPGGDGPSTYQPLWWPREHYVPTGSLVQFLPGQLAVFRRDSAALLATALRADSATLAQPDSAFAELHLLSVAAPPAIRPVAIASIRIGSTVALRGTIDAVPQLIGIEVPATNATAPAARTRFGLVPPPALNTLARGTIAVSDPAILTVNPGVNELPNAPDSALLLLAPSTTLPRGARMGVYWETYGVAPDDSIEIAVWISRERDGFLRRLVGTLRIVEDRNTPVAVSWHEARAGLRAAEVPAITPILARALLLDVSGLAPGEYTLEVAVRRGSDDAVRGRRMFVVQ